MRILEVTQRFLPAVGGVERHVADLSRELRRMGASVEVCTTDLQRERPFTRLPRDLPKDPLPVRRHRAVLGFPAPHGLGIAAPGMLGEILRTNADVVHAHAFGHAPTWFGALGRALRVRPLVITTHSDEGRGGPFSSAYARSVAALTLRNADAVIALTEHERLRLVRLGVRADRIHVLPNGIDLREYPEPRGRPSGGSPVEILFVGRVYPEQKGLDVLIDAVARLPPEPAWRLSIVGEDWGGTDRLVDQARRRGVSERIRFTGRVDAAALRSAYEGADVFVLPSRFEPFGIVLLEAMAHGLPIVASHVGGIPEIVSNGRTGRLVAPGDPEALASVLQELLGDAELRRRFGAEGRRSVQRYDWSRLAPRFLELFTALGP